MKFLVLGQHEFKRLTTTARNARTQTRFTYYECKCTRGWRLFEIALRMTRNAAKTILKVVLLPHVPINCYQAVLGGTKQVTFWLELQVGVIKDHERGLSFFFLWVIIQWVFLLCVERKRVSDLYWLKSTMFLQLPFTFYGRGISLKRSPLSPGPR